jgi:anti-sigma regulatory factor (Ser/Thr protein kinase)/ABC-type transporter Mla MlaB component
MDTLTTRLQRRLDPDITVLSLFGVLTMRTAPVLWQALEKCLAECPVAVVIDLAGLRRVEPLAMTIFPAALATHRRSLPEVGLVVSAPERSLLTRAARTALGGEVLVVEDLADGIVRGGTARAATRRFVAELPDSPDSPRRARETVARACRSWGLTEVTDRAQLIASELVTNAYRHGGGQCRLDVLRRGPFLLLRVTDGSPERPVPPPDDPPAPGEAVSGRGLWLVELYSTAWGVQPRPDGKTVWATLRIVPVGPAELDS